MGKKACLIVYDAELGQYDIIELIPSVECEKDLGLMEWIWKHFQITTKYNWKDAIIEIGGILRNSHKLQ